MSDIPSSFTSDAVGAFTWRLYEESTNPFQWETYVILHRKRNKIVGILVGNELDRETSNVESVEEEDCEGEPRSSFVKSHDYLSNWIAGVSVSSADHAQEPSEGLETEGLHFSQFADYEQFIRQSDAYLWLLSKIRQYGRLSFGSPNVMGEIGALILGLLQAQA